MLLSTTGLLHVLFLLAGMSSLLKHLVSSSLSALSLHVSPLKKPFLTSKIV